MGRSRGGFLKTPRYGLKIRRRYDYVMSRAKSTYRCPRCGSEGVRRVMLGVWRCRKCGFEFAGGAWDPKTSVASSAESSLRRVTEQA